MALFGLSVGSGVNLESHLFALLHTP
uniref:Uncharacterized protein n=1 Tax=Anguilla anguilla TaxID=7936 RepID=A0A0E9PRB6_ANGAN